MAGNSNEPGRSVTSRVLGILGAFDAEHPALGLTDLSRRAGIPLATTHRLVAELTVGGALERDERGRYRIGIRLWEAGLLSDPYLRLRELAMPYLQDLYEATRENVHLAIRDGDQALYIEKLTGHRSVPTVSRTGGRLPLHATGVGKALLAWEPEEFLLRYLSQPLARPTRYSLTEPGRLQRDLERTRRRGFAITKEEMTLGSFSVASPVLDPDGRPAAAIGVVVRSSRVEVRRLAPQVLATARGVAEDLARLARTGEDGPWPDA
jgi:DNA-binding IclR family transcriptional regulator